MSYAARLLLGAFLEYVRAIENYINKRIGPWVSPRRYQDQ